MPPLLEPRIMLAHDYLTQRGGAERVALLLAQHLPIQSIYTSVYNDNQTYPEFAGMNIETSPIQRFSFARRDPRLASLLLHRAWRSMTSDADVTLVSSSGWAHAIRVKPGSKKIVYCHNPPRWLYQPHDYFPSYLVRPASWALSSHRVADKRAARDADVYIANSSVVARRIWLTYGLEARIVHPPVSIDTTGTRESLDIEPGYWLSVGRGKGYKNTAKIVNAVRQSKRHRLVVVGQKPVSTEPDENVTWCGVVSDAQLRWLYANARALVSVSYEDFGLTPLEANAFGTPSLVLRAGGFLDTLAEGVSGSWIMSTTEADILSAMDKFGEFDPRIVKGHAERFSPERFLSRIEAVISEVWDSRDMDARLSGWPTANLPNFSVEQG